MIKFEVPFNFDPRFVSKFSDRRDLLEYIDCFYVAAWKDDCDNTRIITTFSYDYPREYNEYVDRLVDLISLGIDICILAQKNVSLDTIEKYISLGIKAFIINDDELAKKIKEKHPDVRLTLSITRALSLEEIVSGDFSMYDRIVLFHWFSRHLDACEKLPKKYKYVIIANSRCYYDCKWHDAHWFLKSKTIDEYGDAEHEICQECYSLMANDIRKASLIEPEDLSYFDPYVVAYKLTDRCNPTELIIDDLCAYAHRMRGCPKDRAYYNVDENEAAN